MATPAEIQTQLNESFIKLLHSAGHDNGTLDSHYVVGLSAPYSGRSMWVQTTAAQTATQQSDAIKAALVLFR